MTATRCVLTSVHAQRSTALKCTKKERRMQFDIDNHCSN